MKNILWIIILIFLNCKSFGQSGTNEYKAMIDSAIVMQSAHLNENGRVYLIDQNNQPYILESDKSQQKFKSISVESKENRKLIMKGIRAWKVIPTLINNQLTVMVVDFYVTYSKRNYNFSNGGGAKVIFEYSCDQKKWLLVESSWSGI